MTEKRPKRDKKFSVEELYKNKNFVPPKEKNLETIFEEPRKSKDGMPILTSVRKYRRYLQFDPTEGKIQKRKLKAKKCINKIKLNNLRTRSSTKAVQKEDLFLYILDNIGESSDSDMEVAPHESEMSSGEQKKSLPKRKKKVSKITVRRKKSERVQSVDEIFDEPPNVDVNLQETSDSQKAQETPSTSESEQSTKTEGVHKDTKEDSCLEKLETPEEVPSRRSTCIVN